MVGIRREPLQDISLSRAAAQSPVAPSSKSSPTVTPEAELAIGSLLEDISDTQAHDVATMDPQEVTFGHSAPSSSMSRSEVSQFLSGQLGESFQSLPPAQQEQLISVVQSMNMSPEDLTAQTMQGANQVSSITQSLEILISDGRLTPEVLSAMGDLSTSEMHPDLNIQRPLILQSALHEIANPRCIAQHNRGTCAATVPQAKLAIENPEKYLNLIRDLTSPGGQVGNGIANSSHGISMSREPGTIMPDGSFRSITSRLIQPAFMEYANGQMDYNNSTDQHSDSTGGLTQSQTMVLVNGLFDNGYQSLSPAEGHSPEEMIERMTPFLDRGIPIPVGMVWSSGGQHSGHEIMLTKIDAENNQAFFYNPWGELKSIPLDVLSSRLIDCCIPTSIDQAPANSMNNLTMSDFSEYEPMSMAEFDTPRHFESMDNLTDEQLESITDLLDNDLSQSDIGNLDEIAQNSPEQILNSILESLSVADNLTDLSTELDIQSSLSLLSEEERAEWLPLFSQLQQDSGITNEDSELYDLFDAIQEQQISPTDFGLLLERTDLSSILREELTLSDASKPISNELTALFNQLHHHIHTEGSSEGQTTQELIQQTIDKLEEFSNQEHNIEEALSQLRQIIGDNIIQQQKSQSGQPFQLIDF